ncbi:ring finger domain containing protein [Nitzschia inconspicua]|uniref:Ring finger domain containing protein n=1 Tax=Nitzschia inconspicua TaxID=303405 RepID=A0A9K3KRB5_9STRA|nr:ring finger domain containing protein [Nitzschia inconspicua]
MSSTQQQEQQDEKASAGIALCTSTVAPILGDDVDGKVQKREPRAAKFKRTTKPKPEKRLKRHRTSPPSHIRDRIARSMTQRMFLIQKGEVEVKDIPGDGGIPALKCKGCTFSILGSTGNCYDVKIQRLPHCTCPDHAKGNLCKHILFVLLKVMQIPPDSPLIYQSAWLSTELEEMFATMEQRFSRVRGDSSVIANEKVQKAYLKMQKGESFDDNPSEEESSKQKAVGVNDDCPICFDPLLEGTTQNAAENTLSFCRVQCGANFHKACIKAWLSQHRTNPTCPLCRQPWDDGSTSKTCSNTEEGYANLGTLQGQAKRRDTSSYYSSSYYKRSRFY